MLIRTNKITGNKQYFYYLDEKQDGKTPLGIIIPRPWWHGIYRILHGKYPDES